MDAIEVQTVALSLLHSLDLDHGLLLSAINVELKRTYGFRTATQDTAGIALTLRN